MLRTLAGTVRRAAVICVRPYSASPVVCDSAQPRKLPIVGYPPIEPLSKAKAILNDLYGQILTALEEIPPTAGYRQIVEATTKHRQRVVAEENTYEAIEERIGTGYVEELIEQAQDELALIPHVVRWRPWEAAEGQAGAGPILDDAAAAKKMDEQIANSTAKPAAAAATK